MNQQQSGGPFPVPSEGEQHLKALYERYRQEFTAADLQKYTQIEDGVPLEQVIAEMEQIYQASRARKS